MNSRPANRAGRSSAVALRKSQMPCRSTWPSAVRGSGDFLLCAAGAADNRATVSPQAMTGFQSGM